jgi:hypothetical protein
MTYSIVARDPAHGHMGVATQSQEFSVGSSVSWAVPGQGAIATQSMGEPTYGELGLGARFSQRCSAFRRCRLEGSAPYRPAAAGAMSADLHSFQSRRDELPCRLTY